MNEEIDYFEKESSIDLISLNYEKRLERRDSKRDEVETRRNNKLEELAIVVIMISRTLAMKQY